MTGLLMAIVVASVIGAITNAALPFSATADIRVGLIERMSMFAMSTGFLCLSSQATSNIFGVGDPLNVPRIYAGMDTAFMIWNQAITDPDFHWKRTAKQFISDMVRLAVAPIESKSTVSVVLLGKFTASAPVIYRAQPQPTSTHRLWRHHVHELVFDRSKLTSHRHISQLSRVCYEDSMGFIAAVMA